MEIEFLMHRDMQCIERSGRFDFSKKKMLVFVVCNFLKRQDMFFLCAGEKADVTGTIFDLRKGVRLGDVLNDVPGGGFDHNFCLMGPTGKRHTARLVSVRPKFSFSF